ncbi:TPA: hypothetical protein U0K67_001987 [Streptococcus suis]|nr:hypothetical protein [Streptococcus suis]
MKKTYVTLATVAALTAVAMAAPTAKADIQEKLNTVKRIPTAPSYDLQLAQKLSDAVSYLATAQAELPTAQSNFETKKTALKDAQEDEKTNVKRIEDATAAALEAEEVNVTTAANAVKATEDAIKAKQDEIVAAQAQIKQLSLTSGLTGQDLASAIGAQEAIITAAQSAIVTLNTQLVTDKENLADAQDALAEWKAERARQDAREKKRYTDATATAQRELTAAETEVSEWKVVIETLKKEVEAAKFALVKNGLTDAQIAQIIADAQAQVETPATTATPVYRLYNAGLKVHLYTTDKNEYEVLAERGWNQEGVAFKSAKEGKPVYRLYNAGLKVHLYTTDANEYATLAGRGWNQEGVAFRSAEEGTPVYRVYNADLKKHLYTTDANEYKVLGERGWKQEGVAFYSAK